MKNNWVYLLLFSLLSLNIYGQNTLTDRINPEYQKPAYQKNEIRFNLLEAVYGFPEINYERFINESFGIGIAGAYPFYQEFRLGGAVIPYGRFYFGSKPVSGFFIEANLAVVFNVFDKCHGTSDFTCDYYTGYGIGSAGGYKLITKNNWVGEAYFGLGTIFREYYPRCGITIGKRFGK